MSFQEVVLEGTLKPDGTLELDEKPNLAPGRVKIILQPATPSAPGQEGWWPYLQRVRAEREAAGYHFLNEAEMQAHLDSLREEEDRLDRIYRDIEMQKHRADQP
jgi:hypothetical protein